MEPPTAVDPGAEMARVRHDLMNPLTVIVGYAQILAGREDLDPDVRSQAASILDAAQECTRILDRTRDRRIGPLSRMEGDETRRRILAVDDEPVILKLIHEVLEPEFEVVSTASPEEALRLLFTEDFDTVLLDFNLGMPLTGRQVYETLLVQQPDVAEKVVFISGGAMTEGEQEFLDRTSRGCIQKPFHVADLLHAVGR